MNARNTLSRLLPISLTLGLLAPACDSGGTKAADAKETKAGDEKAPADAKAQEKAAEPEADAKPDAEAEADAKPDAAEADAKPDAEAEADAKPEDAADDEGASGDDAEGDDANDAEPEPKADKPKADKPKADKPKADKPKADKPKADKPKTDEPKPEPAASKVDAKAIYLKKCKSCHGVTGAADTKIAAKHDIESWKEPGWKGKWTLSKVKDIVKNGKSGTKMKSFKSKLTAEEIDAVSVYARGLGK